MKNLTKITSVALLLTTLGSNAQQTEVLPRAFYKRCLVTSISGGPSRAFYATYDTEGKKVKSDIAQGAIDPFIMEYGLTNKIGLGFSYGGETYGVNVNEYYNANILETSPTMNAITKYLTFDFSYHPYSTKRLDISLFGSAGFFRVSGTAYSNLQSGLTYDADGNPITTSCFRKEVFNYYGRGAVIRTGARARYYFSKRFGLMAMYYYFNGLVKEKQKPNTISDQKPTSGYYTMINGMGLEFGLCFRIFKQKGVIKEESRLEKRAHRQKIREESEPESDKVPLFRLVWD